MSIDISRERAARPHRRRERRCGGNDPARGAEARLCSLCGNEDPARSAISRTAAQRPAPLNLNRALTSNAARNEERTAERVSRMRAATLAETAAVAEAARVEAAAAGERVARPELTMGD